MMSIKRQICEVAKNCVIRYYKDIGMEVDRDRIVCAILLDQPMVTVSMWNKDDPSRVFMMRMNNDEEIADVKVYDVNPDYTYNFKYRWTKEARTDGK